MVKHNIGTRAKGIGGKRKLSISRSPDVIGMCEVKRGEPYIEFTTSDIITICKCKHYRVGFEGLLNYSRLQELLKEKGLTDDQIKECLHP